MYSGVLLKYKSRISYIVEVILEHNPGAFYEIIIEGYFMNYYEIVEDISEKILGRTLGDFLGEILGQIIMEILSGKLEQMFVDLSEGFYVKASVELRKKNLNKKKLEKY